MDLQTFVAESLKQITQGVDQAHKEGVRSGGRSFTPVEFDVAVTVSEGTDKKGGIGIFTGVVKAGGQKGSSTSTASVSRIKFSVQLLLPDKQS